MIVSARNNELLGQKRWREFLLTIPEDTKYFIVMFDDLGALKSFKSTAYEINSDGVGEKTFSLILHKPNLTCEVTVKRRSEC